MALGLANATQGPSGTLADRSLPHPSLPFIATDWATMMMGPFARAFFAARAIPPSDRPDPGQPADESNVRKVVQELKQEIDALRRELRKKN